MDGILAWFEGIKADFILNFIEKDRWLMLVKGLGNTLLMTTYATIIGVIIGIIIAVIRCTWDLNGKRIKNPLARGVLAVLNRIGVIYGVGIGVINFAIRTWGAYPEGVTYAILLMNIATPLIERVTRPRKYGEVKRHA